MTSFDPTKPPKATSVLIYEGPPERDCDRSLEWTFDGKVTVARCLEHGEVLRVPGRDYFLGRPRAWKCPRPGRYVTVPATGTPGL